jgi:hypothetical protein
MAFRAADLTLYIPGTTRDNCIREVEQAFQGFLSGPILACWQRPAEKFKTGSSELFDPYYQCDLR